MSTRIYPLTKNESNLEKLAGVKPGTIKRLKEFEIKYPEFNENPQSEKGYQAYLLLTQDKDLEKY